MTTTGRDGKKQYIKTQPLSFFFPQALFADPAVLASVQVLHTVNGLWGQLGRPEKAGKVHFSDVPCTRVSMDFFDRLYDTG